MGAHVQEDDDDVTAFLLINKAQIVTGRDGTEFFELSLQLVIVEGGIERVPFKQAECVIDIGLVVLREPGVSLVKFPGRLNFHAPLDQSTDRGRYAF